MSKAVVAGAVGGVDEVVVGVAGAAVDKVVVVVAGAAVDEVVVAGGRAVGGVDELPWVRPSSLVRLLEWTR